MHICEINNCYFAQPERNMTGSFSHIVQYNFFGEMLFATGNKTQNDVSEFESKILTPQTNQLVFIPHNRDSRKCTAIANRQYCQNTTSKTLQCSETKIKLHLILHIFNYFIFRIITKPPLTKILDILYDMYMRWTEGFAVISALNLLFQSN